MRNQNKKKSNEIVKGKGKKQYLRESKLRNHHHPSIVDKDVKLIALLKKLLCCTCDACQA
jgi:hypothetical protein